MGITILVLIVEYLNRDRAQLVSYGVNTELKEEFLLFSTMIGKSETQISKEDLLHS